MEVLHCGNVGVDLAGDISDGMKLGAITGHTGCRILIRTNDMKVVTHGPKYRIWVISSPLCVGLFCKLMLVQHLLVVLTINRTSFMKRGERGKI